MGECKNHCPRHPCLLLCTSKSPLNTKPMTLKNQPQQQTPFTMNDEDKAKYICRRRCLIIVLVIIIIVIILSILGATAFRARRPITTVNAVSVKDLDISFDALKLNVHLNVTLNADITVKNPNKVGVKFSDSSAYLNYRGQLVGQAPIPAGQIGAGQTLPVHLTLTVMADKFLSNSQEVFDDVVKSGVLPLTTHTRIYGRVTVLFFSVHVVSYATCNMNISVASKSLADNECTYNTRLT